MGLLDEAIRDHLELKRRQGADPGEIARKEREALEPVLSDEPATWGADSAYGLLDPSEEPSVPDSGEAAPSPDALAVDFSTVGQETAEFDMREVLGDGEYAPAQAYLGDNDTAPAPVRAGRILGGASKDSLEWEVAGHAAAEPVHDIPGQERLSFE